MSIYSRQAKTLRMEHYRSVSNDAKFHLVIFLKKLGLARGIHPWSLFL